MCVADMPRMCCRYAAYMLHACCRYACMLHACCLHAACMLPACCMHAACMLPACCMHAACMLPACCLHAACMLLACCMHAAGMLYACCIYFAACVLDASLVSCMLQKCCMHLCLSRHTSKHSDGDYSTSVTDDEASFLRGNARRFLADPVAVGQVFRHVSRQIFRHVDPDTGRAGLGHSGVTMHADSWRVILPIGVQ